MKNRLIIILILCATTSLALASDIGTWRLLLPKQAYTVRTNPKNPDRIYIGNWANQILVSNDRGATWETMEVGSLSVTNFITSIHICPEDTATIIVGGYVFPGIKRSTDGGATFNTVFQDLSGRQAWFVSEAITQAVDGTIYAARGRGISAVYRSTDKGETWDSISVIPFSETPKLHTIAAHNVDANLLFLGASRGKIYRSEDGGHSWSLCSVNGRDTIRDDSEIPKIVFSPNNPDVGYAVVSIGLEENIAGNGGILKSTDRGRTWNRIGFPDTSFWAVDVLPTKDGSDDVLLGGFRVTEADTIVKGDSLVYRSRDGGQTWERYKGITWKRNELGQSARSIWSFYRDPTTNTEYMATLVGLYVLDESTDVNEDARSKAAKLFTQYNGSNIVVTDMAPAPTDKTWQLYDAAANLVASGSITAPTMALSTPSLASGSYLLVWGSDARFRTVSVVVAR